MEQAELLERVVHVSRFKLTCRDSMLYEIYVGRSVSGACFTSESSSMFLAAQH